MKNTTLAMRMSDGVLERLEQVAQLEHLTMAAWARRAIMTALELAEEELAKKRVAKKAG